MPAEKLEQFGGELPAWNEHLLPAGQAALAQNGYLFSGALTGWRQPKLLRNLNNSAARFAFRIPIVSETQAIAYLVFKALPSGGDTFSVGDLTYTWVLGGLRGGSGGNLSAVPYTINIGADTATCALNALAALTADNGTNQNAGTIYGTNTTENGAIAIYPPGATPLAGLPAPSVGTVNIAGTYYSYVQIGAPDFGSAFNTTTVSEITGNTRTTWLKDLLSFADTTGTFSGGTNASFDSTITGPATWLEFLDQDTDVVRSQVVDDAFSRWYFASPSQQPTYNTAARITAGQPAWLLGVPAPGCAPGVSVAGGGNSLTLGNLTGAGTGISVGANNIFLVQITPTGATQLEDIQFFAETAAPTASFAAVIFQDNNGAPGGLLDTGGIVTGVVAGANESPFLNPPDLLANTAYWIGFMTDTTINVEIAANGVTNTSAFSNTFDNGPPATAPAATVSAGFHMFADLISSAVQEARSYVYTWLSAYTEEGPPSPATLVDGWSNGTWTLNPIFNPNPNELGVDRNLAFANVYRTVVGTSGSTVFFYVATLRLSDWAFSLTGTSGPWYSGNAGLPLPASLTANGIDIVSPTSATGQFVDTLPDNMVSLNNELGSTTWFPPPENLQGLVTMPNGVFAGFKNNEVWFCEPYQPHAWPPGFVITTDFPIVGLGVTNAGLIVCTSATPYVIGGTQPANFSALKCNRAEPCLSRRSILNGDGAVTYMSPNGLIQVTPSGQCINTTDLWMTRDKWQTLVPQKYTRAIELASSYFCFGTTAPVSVPVADHSVAQQGFTIELAADAQSFSIWPQPGGHRLGFQRLTSHIIVGGVPQNVDNVLHDPWTGVGVLIGAGAVWYYDFGDPQPVPVPYDWKSKIYQNNTRKNYAAYKVFFTVPPGVAAPTGNRVEAEATDPVWNTLGATQYLIVKVYADIGVDASNNPNGAMTLVDCKEVRRSGEMLRLPSNFKAEQWQFELVGRVIIANMQVATSAKGLANV